MRKPLLAAALALAVVPAVRADHTAARFELTPTFSYRFGGSLDATENELFDTDLEVEDSEAYGVTFDIPISEVFQIELLASRQSGELQFDDGLFEGSPTFADIDVTYYHVGVLWQWGNRRVSPFFTMSLGVATLDPDFPGASEENRFSGSLGGGVKIFFSENVGLRFEGRGFWSDLGSYDDDNDFHCHDYDDYNDSCYGNEFTQGQASVGLILAW